MSPEHSFANQLVNWYNSNKRPLPWRETKDPYKIWLSEIILQQTRVSQGLPYYLKFMTEFPTIHDLAKANEQKVLSLWQGLGYYSRARNLHQCAIYISDKLGGKFPSSYLELLKLPGIGPYTAAAIASIAFGEAVPVVDGNVYRVLSRLFGIEADIGQSKNREIFYEHALQLIQNQDPDTFNQAMMEFGAMHCMPRNPLCEECFVSSECYANLHGKQESFPIKSKKIKVRKRYFNYIVFFFEDGLLMRERSEGDIWQGLNDFYCIESGQLFDEEEGARKYGVRSISSDSVRSIRGL